MFLLNICQLFYYIFEAFRFVVLDFRDRVFLTDISKFHREKTTFIATFHFPLRFVEEQFTDYLTQSGFEYEISIRKTGNQRQVLVYINPKKKNALKWYHRLRFQARLMPGVHMGLSYGDSVFPLLEPSQSSKPSLETPPEE